MMLRLAGYELRMLGRDRLALLMTAVLGAVLLCAWIGDQAAQSRDNAVKADIARQERLRWLQQGEKDPHSAAHYSIFAFRPAPPLASLDAGILPYVGQAVWLEAHVQNDMLHRPRGEASAIERAGTVSPGALLVGFAPLMAFVLAFATLARERESGAWRLALGNARHPYRIILPKALACWSLLFLLLVVPLGIVAGAGRLLAGELHADEGLRLLAWMGVFGLYLGTLVCIGLVVCLLSPRPRVALLILFGTWMLLGVIAPRAASALAGRQVPLPATQTVKQTLAREAAAYWTAEDGERHLQALLKRHGVSRREDLPVDARGAELDLVERHSHQVFDRVLGGFHDRVEQQDRRFGALAWLAPSIALLRLSPTLAGTDFSQHRRFIDHAESYRRDLVNRMNADVMAHPANQEGARHTSDRRLWERIPEFHPPATPLASVAGNLVTPLIALLAWALAAALMLGFAARRTRP